MSDIDVNKIQQIVKELQDQNAIDFQQWKKLGKEIEKLSEKIKLSDTNLSVLMKKIKNDYEKLKKVIIDENVQIELNNKIEDNKNDIVDNKNKIEQNINEINKKVNTETFQNEVDEINLQMDTNVQNLIIKINDVAEKGTTKEVVIATTQDIIQKKIENGSLANLTIGNKTIGIEKINYIESNPNLLKGLVTTSGYYDTTDGHYVQNDDYYTTSLFMFTDSIFYTNCTDNITFFDINKAFISSLTGGTYTSPVTKPKNAFYIAVTFLKKRVYDDFYLKSYNFDNYIIKDEKYKNLLEETAKTKVINDFKQIIKRQENKIIPLNKVQGFEYEISNIYDKNTNEADGSYINQQGKVVFNSNDYGNYKASGYYLVKANEPITCNYKYNYALYDTDKSLVKFSYGGWNGHIIPTVDGYIRFTLPVNKNDIIISYSETPKDDDKFVIDDFIKTGLIHELGIKQTKLQNIKWNVFGDSMSSVDYSKPTWWQIIAEKNNIIATCYGISGTTLAHTNDRHLWDYNWGKLNADEIGYNRNDSSTWSTGNCFCERFVKMSNEADLITIMGSTNDNAVKLGNWGSTDTSTFYGALNILIQGLINKYPNKKIAFFTPMQQANSYTTNVANPGSELDKKSSEDTLSLQLRAEAIKRKCNQYSIPCLDLYSISGVNGVGNKKALVYRNNDDTHLSVFGNEYIVPVIESFLLSLF